MGPKKLLGSLALMALVLALALWPMTPAFAHGGEEGGEEQSSVELTEQALGILISLPQASDEALERVEAAVKAEIEEPTGDLDVGLLEEAGAALEEGDVRRATNLLELVLDDDPNAPRQEQKVESGFRTPSGGDAAALVVAVLMGVAGIALVRQRKEAH
ncbi:hypothetical protein BMS3Abin02_02334 [bacterium BMS3Abin02]|nr:hypothetical protein BMS3Abin02_02334 [bacterium BMS3Abin02]